MSKVKNEMRVKTFVDSRPAADGKFPIEHDVNEFCKTVDAVDIQVHLPSDRNDPVTAAVVYNETW